MTPQQINDGFVKVGHKITEMDQTLLGLGLGYQQQQGINEEYRRQIFFLEHKVNMLCKMLGETNVMAKDAVETRWPLYLENDVGVVGQDGKMKGSVKVTFYDN
jgi:hypothetical protein